MKIALIYPAITVDGFSMPGARPRTGWIHHGLCYISASLKARGHDVSLIDLRQLSSWDELAPVIRNISPDVVGITMMSVDFDSALRAAGIIKEVDSRIPIIAGGPHPSLMEEELISRKEIDYIFKGEAEVTLPDILEGIVRDGIKDNRFGFKGFFGNCNRFFLRQLGVSAVLWIPAWILTLVMAILLGWTIMESKTYPLTAAVFGASSAVVALLLLVFSALICMSWTITAADDKGVFKSIWRSVLFCGQRFFSVFGLLVLFFVLMMAISLVVWIAYAFMVEGLRRLGLDGHIIILREVTGCMLNAYFFLFLTSTLMSYYLNNRKEDERYN